MVSLRDARYQVLKNLFGPLVTDVLCPTQLVGETNIPTRGPALLICNHRSVMDPYLFSASSRRVVNWVMAPFVSSIPVFGWLASQAGAISIIKDEAGKSEALMDEMERVLRQNRLVGIFPEGMNNFREPAGPLDLALFHGTFMRLVLRAQIPNLPVIPAAIWARHDTVLGEIQGSLLQLFDPGEKTFNVPEMKLTGYQEALILVGKPLYFDHYYGQYTQPEDPRYEDPAQAALIGELVAQVRGNVHALLERADRLDAPAEPLSVSQPIADNGLSPTDNRSAP